MGSGVSEPQRREWLLEDQQETVANQKGMQRLRQESGRHRGQRRDSGPRAQVSMGCGRRPGDARSLVCGWLCPHVDGELGVGEDTE